MIYVLWSGEYDDRAPVAAFRSESAAQEWVGQVALSPTSGVSMPRLPLELEPLELHEPKQDAQQSRGGGTQRDHLAAVLGESAPEAMDASWGRLMELVRERSERLAELETRPTVPGAGIARLAQWFVDRQFASQETGPTLARHAMDAYWGPAV